MQNNINQKIVNKLNELKLTISTCESMTGGAVAANLVLAEHASQTFLGSMVTYHPNVKMKLARVSKETIDEYGTVSVQCAHEMAKGCQQSLKTDIAISITGNASTSNPIENQPSGMAYICIRLFDKNYDYKFISSFNDRNDTINQCVAFVLNNLWQLIEGLKK